MRLRKGGLLACALFAIASALLWWSVNFFDVTSADGFDPTRYEGLARQPDLAVGDYLFSDSYRIVAFLHALYTVLPFYWGYVFVAACLLYLALRFGRGSVLPVALLSPISFYYFAQTGKDWISILAWSCAAVALLGHRRASFVAFTVLCTALAFMVRPPLVFGILAVMATMIRYGFRRALLVAVVAGLVGALIQTHDEDFLIAASADALGLESSGTLVRLFREYSFGYGPVPILLKLAFYSTSILFQPVLFLVKAGAGGVDGLYVLFEAVCFWVFLLQVVRSVSIVKFMKYSLPLAIFLSLSGTFYHFRYLEITYPVVFMYMVHLKRSRALPGPTPAPERLGAEA
jgi:hypothetical protein